MFATLEAPGGRAGFWVLSGCLKAVVRVVCGCGGLVVKLEVKRRLWSWRVEVLGCWGMGWRGDKEEVEGV